MTFDRHVGEFPMKRFIHEALLARWMITDTFPDKTFRQYLLGIVHLRPVAGSPDAAKSAPEATHEMTLVQLDQTDRTVPYSQTEDPFLRFADVTMSVQLMLPTDEVAQKICTAIAQGIARSYLSTDPRKNEAALAQWQATLSTTVDAIVDEYEALQSVVN